uniref:Chromo domain-containing protein n=1 Tax=Rhabditophanes sp. KR3021 TaxID=114890 RepID=A0AC35UDJ2_9BILA
MSPGRKKEFYIVEEVVKEALDNNGVSLAYVKWKGFAKSQNTWEVVKDNIDQTTAWKTYLREGQGKKVAQTASVKPPTPSSSAVGKKLGKDGKEKNSRTMTDTGSSSTIKHPSSKDNVTEITETDHHSDGSLRPEVANKRKTTTRMSTGVDKGRESVSILSTNASTPRRYKKSRHPSNVSIALAVPKAELLLDGEEESCLKESGVGCSGRNDGSVAFEVEDSESSLIDVPPHSPPKKRKLSGIPSIRSTSTRNRSVAGTTTDRASKGTRIQKVVTFLPPDECHKNCRYVIDYTDKTTKVLTLKELPLTEHALIVKFLEDKL